MLRLPELKSFLRNFEAEEYEGVTVQYMRGRSPTLVIYHDGKRKEKIELNNSFSNDDLHKLMINKGFVKMSEDEIAQMKEVNFAKQRSEQLRRQKEKKERRKRRKQQMDKDKKLAHLVKRNTSGIDSQNMSESKFPSHGDEYLDLVKTTDRKNLQSGSQSDMPQKEYEEMQSLEQFDRMEEANPGNDGEEPRYIVRDSQLTNGVNLLRASDEL